MNLARVVAPFYYDEYLHEIDDAASGRFTFFGQEVDFGSPSAIDWHHEVAAESDFHLWRMKLAHMGFVCPMLVVGDEQHLTAVGELLRSYRQNSDFGVAGCFSSYWFPYSVSHRVLAILSGYVLAFDRTEISQALREEIESFLRWNVAFILVNVEHELRNNHVERNLAALTFYLGCTGGAGAKLSRRLDREVRRVMDACLLADGMIAERSAMYQGLAVMAADVFARSACLSEETRARARAMHEQALRAWLTMSHPDGGIALFNDSWFGEVPEARIIAGDSDVGPVGLLPHAGYARLEAADVFLLMDAGSIGPRWNPGHGHADFLSVELDVAGRRFVVDPGTYQYSTGPRRAFERSAKSHNGPTKSGIEPVEYFGCFRVGRLRAAEMTAFDDGQYGGAASGRLGLPGGTVVSRTVAVEPGIVRVTDQWTGDAAGGHVRLTVPEEWELVGHDDKQVLFRQGGGDVVIRALAGVVVSVDEGEWSCNYLESRRATIVGLRPALDGSTNGRLVWDVRPRQKEADLVGTLIPNEIDGEQ